MEDLAKKNNLEFLDLNKKSFEEYNKYSEDELNAKFANCYNIWGYNDLVRYYHLSKEEAKKESRENTHFEKRGAKIVATWIKELACDGEASEDLCRQFK